MQLLRNLGMIALLLGLGAPALAAPPGLAGQLRQGGYVLLMRHASSPANPPDKALADPDNSADERQLDDQGRVTAQAMGEALRSLRIPLGPVFCSPAYRARETVKLAGFGAPALAPELGDQGQSMMRITVQGPALWLKNKVAETPPTGRNTLLVTHMPNIAAAFPDEAAGLKDGETLVFKPDGHGHADLVARVTIEEWPQMTK
jgi:phosphohistidine phosphatase SixA